MAQGEDTFYVVGGYNGSFVTGAFDTVYRYEQGVLIKSYRYVYG